MKSCFIILHIMCTPQYTMCVCVNTFVNNSSMNLSYHLWITSKHYLLLLLIKAVRKIMLPLHLKNYLILSIPSMSYMIARKILKRHSWKWWIIVTEGILKALRRPLFYEVWFLQISIIIRPCLLSHLTASV